MNSNKYIKLVAALFVAIFGVVAFFSGSGVSSAGVLDARLSSQEIAAYCNLVDDNLSKNVERIIDCDTSNYDKESGRRYNRRFKKVNTIVREALADASGGIQRYTGPDVNGYSWNG